jgi:hypothetical protein
MMKNDSQLKADISNNETRAQYGAWLIVIGLVIEVVLTIALPHGKTFVENWGPVIATALIALGVYGEILFSGRASEAHKDLQLSTEGKLAEALNRAANAEQALVDFRRPRRHLMTAENRALLIARLSQFGGTEFDTGLSPGGEPMHFLWDLEETLRDAGWRQLPWGVAAVGVQVVHRNLRPLAGSINAENVEIHLDPSSRAALLPAATGLISALTEIGIAAWEAPFNVHNAHTHAMHILIGPKG